jgi:hypothetical protein
MGQGVIEGGRRGAYFLWFVATLAFALLVAVPILVVLSPRSGRARRAGLSIEPRTVDLTDKIVKEGEYISVRFQLIPNQA